MQMWMKTNTVLKKEKEAPEHRNGKHRNGKKSKFRNFLIDLFFPKIV